MNNIAGGVFDNGKPIVAVDIDGTLADYHGYFLKFAEQWFGRSMPSPYDCNPGRPLHEHMQVDKRDYRECKLAYRQGGMKRSMPMLPQSSELVKALRGAGAEVWITTTRPYLRLDNIDPDTREWLRRNDIQYDAILYGEGKYKELVEHVGAHRVLAVFDDLPEMIDQAGAVGVQHRFLRDQPYNQHMLSQSSRDLPLLVEVESLVAFSQPIRIYNNLDVYTILKREIEAYSATQEGRRSK